MDKRKLSAIPRDKATADMLETANRLENIKHIVTARLIDENKILLLNFYEVSGLKSGKTEAAFRTFLSGEDYITQDLRQSKVRWLTASFYNMKEFKISEYHRDKRERYYVFIRSKEERELIGTFFKRYEKEERGPYDLEYPWESVKNFQNAVLNRKLEEKRSKEIRRFDEAMAPFKEPPKAFFDWMWETGMSFSRYVIYKEVESGQAECECTYCGNVGNVSRKEIRIRNNEQGKCPFCGSMVTFKARGKLPAQIIDERWFVYVDPTPEGFALRYFSAKRVVRSDSFVRYAQDKTRLEESSPELSRAIYSFPDGKPTSVDYEWNVYKQRGLPRWCPYHDKWYCAESILYPGNLPAAWELTPMKYSALEVLAASIPTKELNYEQGIELYIKFPKIEWFCKMGLNNLAKHVIDAAGSGYGALGKINYKGKTIYEILGLTKVNTRLMQEIDGTDAELRLLQVAQKIGLQFKPEQLREYYQRFECNTKLLRQANKKVSLYKLLKYIAKESERYSVEKQSRCGSYAAYSLKERKAPGIERQKNMANDWLEYLEWCKELKYDLDNMFIYMPKNFKAVHDRTAAEYQMLQEKKAAAEKARREREVKRKMAETQKAMEEIFSKSEGQDAFSIKGRRLILIVPKSEDEIRNEGTELHHCVGGYVEKVARGETNIFFIRKADEPDKPYYTMEWKDNRIVQCRGAHNCEMTPEVRAFTKVFEKKMSESIESAKEEKKKHGKQKQNLQFA